MKTYTVIHYEFGNTKHIYSGINKDLAYEKLNAHPYHYLHTWEDDKEIRYEGNGIYLEFEYQNGKKSITKEIENYMKNENDVTHKDGMVLKEYTYQNGKKKTTKEIKHYQMNDKI